MIKVDETRTVYIPGNTTFRFTGQPDDNDYGRYVRLEVIDCAGCASERTIKTALHVGDLQRLRATIDEALKSLEYPTND